MDLVNSGYRNKFWAYRETASIGNLENAKQEFYMIVNFGNDKKAVLVDETQGGVLHETLPSQSSQIYLVLT